VDETGLAPFGDDQIEGFGTGGFNIGPGGIEVGVVRDNVSGLEHHGEEDALGGAALVSGNDTGVAEDALHGVSEATVHGIVVRREWFLQQVQNFSGFKGAKRLTIP
jgi:hypothetical protein